METILKQIENAAGLAICPKCSKAIQDGELVTGQSWNGEGGEHITCPTDKALAANS